MPQAFSVVGPVRDAMPLVLKLMLPRAIKFVRHLLYPIDPESGVRATRLLQVK
jgi:hypothetical protein